MEIETAKTNAIKQEEMRQSYIFFAAGAGFFAIFILLACLVKTGATADFDWNISNAFFGFRNPGLNTVVEGITYLGEWQVIAVLCLLLLVFPASRKTLGIPVAACALVSTAIRGLIKPFVARPRPDESFWLVEEDGFSFPSGHSITSMAVFALLIFLLWYCYRHEISFSKHEFGKNRVMIATVVLVCIALAIGFSRIYVGVHFFCDVLGGWSAGLGVAACTAGMVVYMNARKKE